MSVELRFGTAKYHDAHPDKIAVFNSNYDIEGKKVSDFTQPWRIKRGRKSIDNGGYATFPQAVHEAARLAKK